MRLEVGLLDEADPHLAFIAVRTYRRARVIDWDVVVDLNSPPAAVQVQLDDVLAFWIVNGICVLVLRENVVADEPVAVLMLELVVCRDGKAA